MTTTQIYRVFIRASAERIWEAINHPDFTERYFYGARIENSAETHSAHGPDGEDWGSGATLEWDPPHRVVHEWRSAYDPQLAPEPASRVTWEIEESGDDLCLLTLTHDRLEASPLTAADVSGAGWTFVLSSLKSLLETGTALARTS
ncbi:MAG: SRPBCC domain-containing protein [Leifsonia sp.]